MVTVSGVREMCRVVLMALCRDLSSRVGQGRVRSVLVTRGRGVVERVMRRTPVATGVILLLPRVILVRSGITFS